MDGLILAGHIKARSPSTPVILLTGADREMVLKKVEKGPIDSVIFKPFMMEDLQRTVQKALASQERKYVSGGGGVPTFAGRPPEHNLYLRQKRI